MNTTTKTETETNKKRSDATATQTVRMTEGAFRFYLQYYLNHPTVHTTFHCPLCTRSADVVDGSITVTDGGILTTFDLECPSCTQHIASTVALPYPL